MLISFCCLFEQTLKQVYHVLTCNPTRNIKLWWLVLNNVVNNVHVILINYQMILLLHHANRVLHQQLIYHVLKPESHKSTCIKHDLQWMIIKGLVLFIYPPLLCEGNSWKEEKRKELMKSYLHSKLFHRSMSTDRLTAIIVGCML